MEISKKNNEKKIGFFVVSEICSFFIDFLMARCMRGDSRKVQQKKIIDATISATTEMIDIYLSEKYKEFQS